jgi:Flp pilus assembly pilin Flp
MKRRTQVLAGLMGVAIIATLTYVAGWLSGETGQALNPVSEA